MFKLTLRTEDLPKQQNQERKLKDLVRILLKHISKKEETEETPANVESSNPPPPSRCHSKKRSGSILKSVIGEKRKKLCTRLKFQCNETIDAEEPQKIHPDDRFHSTSDLFICDNSFGTMKTIFFFKNLNCNQNKKKRRWVLAGIGS